MRAAYRAVLRGNRLEWCDERPKDLSPDRAIEVSVTVLDTSRSQTLMLGSPGERKP
jgi:hypothetical protein